MAFDKEKVQKLFDEHVHPLKLPPKLAGNVRKAMLKAAKKSKGDTKKTKAAIVGYLASRGYDEKGKKMKKGKKAKGEKPAKEKSTKKDKPSKDAGDPAEAKLTKAGGKDALKGDSEKGVPKGNIDLSKLDRRTLKGMCADLDVAYKKDMSDDEVRAAVAKELVGFDKALMQKLEKADPAKIDALDNCIGVMLDLTQAACVTCPAQGDCRKLFAEHAADGWKIFDGLAPGETKELVPTDNLTKKTKKKDKEEGSALNEKQEISVFDFGKVKKLPAVEVQGAAVASNMEHKEFLRALKSEVPGTVGEFRKVVLAHYDADDSDKGAVQLTTWFLAYCEALGVIEVSK